MHPVGFERTISAGERPQTYALDRAASGTGILFILRPKYSLPLCRSVRVMLIAIICELTKFECISFLCNILIILNSVGENLTRSGNVERVMVYYV
jgi:hypothetical protein